MNSTSRPTYFYLFREGKDIKIVSMTDTKAEELWKSGRRWIDVGLKTRKEAEVKRLAYVSESN